MSDFVVDTNNVFKRYDMFIQSKAYTSNLSFDVTNTVRNIFVKSKFVAEKMYLKLKKNLT